MKLTPINSAEAIFEAFFDEQLSGLPKWKVHEGGAEGLQIAQRWAWVNYEWQRPPADVTKPAQIRQIRIGSRDTAQQSWRRVATVELFWRSVRSTAARAASDRGAHGSGSVSVCLGPIWRSCSGSASQAARCFSALARSLAPSLERNVSMSTGCASVF